MANEKVPYNNPWYKAYPDPRVFLKYVAGRAPKAEFEKGRRLNIIHYQDAVEHAFAEAESDAERIKRTSWQKIGIPVLETPEQVFLIPADVDILIQVKNLTFKTYNLIEPGSFTTPKAEVLCRFRTSLPTEFIQSFGNDLSQFHPEGIKTPYTRFKKEFVGIKDDGADWKVLSIFDAKDAYEESLAEIEKSFLKVFKLDKYAAYLAERNDIEHFAS